MKKTNYKLFLYNEMGNAIDCIVCKKFNQLEMLMYGLDDNQLYKAYVGTALYSKHYKL